MSGPSYPSDPDAFSAMLSALAGGSGDAALFVGMLSRASEGTKLAPESKPWQLPVSGMDGPVGDELATSANEGTEAEGVDVSAMLGLPPRVSEEDDGELDGPLLPLDGHVVMTDVEVARRRSVWLWFSSLTPEERDKTLTVTDKHWCSFLLRLVDTVRRKGDGVFVIDVPEEGPVVDAPQGTSGRPRRSSYSGKSSLIASLERSQPEVIFRSWKALGDSIPLSRRSVWNRSCRRVQESVRLGDARSRHDTLTMSRELLTSPSALFDMLDDASLRWFLCHPTPCGPNPNVVEPWTQTDWMCTFNVFTVGSYIANKLEQMIWKGYVASLPTTTLVASPEAATVGPTVADGDIGLRSKSYLADFWNRLSPAERWKIIGSSMAVSDTTSPLKSSKRERRGHVKSVSGAASVTSLASGPSGITSSNGSGSGPVAYGKPSRDDDQATVGSDGHTALLPSSALSVGAASAGNKSFSVFERQRRRADKVSLPGSEPPAGDVLTQDSGSSAFGSPFADGDFDECDAGSAYASGGQGTVNNAWPWCAVRWDGQTVVADFFTSPLGRAGTDMDDWARKIGHKLLSKWADNNAMGLITAEEEREGSKKKSGKVPSSNIAPTDKLAKRKQPRRRRNSLTHTTATSSTGALAPVSDATDPVSASEGAVVGEEAAVTILSPSEQPQPAPAPGPPVESVPPPSDTDTSDWIVASNTRKGRKSDSSLASPPHKSPTQGKAGSPPKPTSPRGKTSAVPKKEEKHLKKIPGSPEHSAAKPAAAAPTAAVPRIDASMTWGDIVLAEEASAAPVLPAVKGPPAPSAAAPRPPPVPFTHPPLPTQTATTPVSVVLHTATVPQPPLVQSISVGKLQALEEQLHTECLEFGMWCFSDSIRRRPYENEVLNRLHGVVSQLIPSAFIQPFGSFATGLSVPNSDVDVVICNTNGGTVRYFHQLTTILKSEAWVTSVIAVATTHIPVIKLTAACAAGKNGSMKIDITFQSPAHRGHGTTALSVALLSAMPPLAPLILAVKQLLVENNLNDPYTGGLSSYGILLLVTCFLQKCGDLRCASSLVSSFAVPASTAAKDLCIPLGPHTLGSASSGKPKPSYAPVPSESMPASTVSPIASDAPSSSPSAGASPIAIGRRNRSRSVDSPSASDDFTAAPDGSKSLLLSPLSPDAGKLFPDPPASVPSTASAVSLSSSLLSNPGQAAPSFGPLSIAVNDEEEEDDDFVGVGPGLPPSPLLGSMLLRLLKFYGSEFHSDGMGVSVRLGGWYPVNRRMAMFVDPVVIPDPAYNTLLTSTQSKSDEPLSKLLFPSWHQERSAPT